MKSRNTKFRTGSWTAHPNRATDAKYTVTHAGGDTLVTVDQEQSNGSWVLLGTFSMAPGSGHKVSLTDQANGYVIADAIQLLDATAPAFNTATWTPNAAAGQYEVYAKWTANGNRATNATYTVTHAQGVTQVPVNQQANGGAFNLLGTFNLNGSGTITLSDQANGYVIADAIQLIPLTTTPQMYFVHTDHLNTPRLIASDTGQAVWSWANDDPYGNNAPNENPAGAGQFTCNLRLPGQYFDAETNTHYNYFRDYDPLTGRYVQSDPIGLAGGLNTYGYVGGNPLSFSDPLGLQRIPFPRFPIPGFPPRGGSSSSNPNSTGNSDLDRALGIPAPGNSSSSSSSSSSDTARARCEAKCDDDYDHRQRMCEASWKMAGRDPSVYRLCMDENRAKTIKCYQDCAKDCK